MNPFSKSISFFFLTILIGNLGLLFTEFLNFHDFSFEYLLSTFQLFLGFILLTGIFCLPLFIPIFIFFILMHTYKPYPPLNLVISTIFGFVLSLVWAFILNAGLEWKDEFTLWGPFVVGATVSGILTELVSGVFQKPASLARPKKNAVLVLKYQK